MKRFKNASLMSVLVVCLIADILAGWMCRERGTGKNQL